MVPLLLFYYREERHSIEEVTNSKTCKVRFGIEESCSLPFRVLSRKMVEPTEELVLQAPSVSSTSTYRRHVVITLPYPGKHILFNLKRIRGNRA
jgi:hypothetical protein